MVRLYSLTTIVSCVTCVACMTLSGCRTIKTKPAFRPNLMYEPPTSTRDSRAALPGRYLGYFRPSDSPFKVPLVFDLVAVKSKENLTRYEGFARFNLASFSGKEFRVEYYPQFVLNHETKVFSSSEVGNQLTLVDARLRAKSIITGKVKDLDKEIGDFLLIYSGNRREINERILISKVFPSRKVFPQLSGEYQGLCNENKAKLSLTQGRWDFGSAEGNGFLTQYRTWAALGIENTVMCGKGRLCAKTIFQQSSLDITHNKITLESEKEKITCTIGTEKLTCNQGCAFERATPIAAPTYDIARAAERQERKDQVHIGKDGVLTENIDFEGAVTGEYFGYLFNETTLKHQLYRLKVTATMSQEAGMQKEAPVISGVGTMFFGSGENNEFSVNKFDGEFYSESGPEFVFKGDGDQIIQVSRWGRRGMRAILYSKAFGRVGTLELSRIDIPNLPDDSILVEQLTGTYTGSSNKFTLLAQPNVSEASRNYFPLLVRGFAQGSGSLNRKNVILELKYDVYSGQFSMLLEDGRLITGHEIESGFELNWRKPVEYGSAITDASIEAFNFTKDMAPGKTATNVLDALHGAGKLKL